MVPRGLFLQFSRPLAKTGGVFGPPAFLKDVRLRLEVLDELAEIRRILLLLLANQFGGVTNCHASILHANEVPSLRAAPCDTVRSVSRARPPGHRRDGRLDPAAGAPMRQNSY
ncbi:hypothetical protein Sfum_3913 [Syntrophobacter fumaroxidans MPOB]|uniref:Uncharacterized protein n=1 Tax=Syntrophobacter fumaroxidans (strain DSM 10017 / MPOB) TaxID=335543 RepID=A0LQ80_SYNFM|nr:hypothetical protein Sfum_3913 [Syntrophobacter fumaroxidans MPOB]